MATSSQSPDLAARVTAARSAVADYRRECAQDGPLVDWLAWARRLATELSGVLGALDAEAKPSPLKPGPGMIQPGGGWISGPGVGAPK